MKPVTWRYTKGRCINDTGLIQSSGSWGSLSFIELSYDSCLDPSAQFRFRDNGAMLNIQRQGCLAAFNKNISGNYRDMFYLYVDSVSLDTAACAQKPSEGIYRAVTQTSNRGLSVYYKGKDMTSFQTWCAQSRYSYQMYQTYGIQYFLELTTYCYYSFHFGKCDYVFATRDLILFAKYNVKKSIKLELIKSTSQTILFYAILPTLILKL